MMAEPQPLLPTWAAKTLLAAVSLVLLASMGGGFILLPVLVPLHVWAARRSGPVGRVLWSLLPAATAIVITWAAVYVAVGEAKPWIWLLPIGAALGSLAAMRRLTRRVSVSPA